MSFKNALLTKNYQAGGTIEQCTIVKFGSSDEVVVKGAAATDLLIGIVDIAQTEDGNSVVSGDRVDVIEAGIAELKLGGTVTRGQLLTSNASAYGVAAAPASGVNNYVIGRAEASGVSGDIIPVMIGVQQIQGE